MSEETLLLFGCAVSFVALAGAYVGLRERFLDRVGTRRGARRVRRRAEVVPAAAVARPAVPRARA